mgnify:CR=1 FL=1
MVAVCGVLSCVSLRLICSPSPCRSYYGFVVGASTVAKATWVYEDPKPRALHLKGHHAFCESLLDECVGVRGASGVPKLCDLMGAARWSDQRSGVKDV